MKSYDSNRDMAVSPATKNNRLTNPNIAGNNNNYINMIYLYIITFL